MSCPWGQLRPALSEPCHVSGYGTEVPNLGLYAKPQCLNLDTWFSEQVWGGLFSTSTADSSFNKDLLCTQHVPETVLAPGFIGGNSAKIPVCSGLIL